MITRVLTGKGLVADAISASNRTVSNQLIVKGPKILSQNNLSVEERAYLERDFLIKRRAIERAAIKGELVWSPNTADVRISSLQSSYRKEVAARYRSRYGVDLDLNRLNADNPVDLIIGGSASQRLKLIDESINKSVGSSLLRSGRSAGLKKGDRIDGIVFQRRD